MNRTDSQSQDCLGKGNNKNRFVIGYPSDPFTRILLHENIFLRNWDDFLISCHPVIPVKNVFRGVFGYGNTKVKARRVVHFE